MCMLSICSCLSQEYRGIHPGHRADIDCVRHNGDIIEETMAKGLVPSEEFGAYIIDSMVTGTPRVI